jgi:hypothetical protein
MGSRDAPQHEAPGYRFDIYIFPLLSISTGRSSPLPC